MVSTLLRFAVVLVLVFCVGFCRAEGDAETSEGKDIKPRSTDAATNAVDANKIRERCWRISQYKALPFATALKLKCACHCMDHPTYFYECKEVKYLLGEILCEKCREHCHRLTKIF